MDLCCSSSVNQEINSLLDDLIDQRKDSFMRRWITLSDSDQVAILTHCLLNSESYSSESLHNIIHTLIYHRTLLSDPFQFWDQASRSLVDRILHLLHKPEQHASLTTVQPLQEKVSLHGVLEAIMLMIQQFTKANYSTRDFFVVEIPANSSTHPYFTVFARYLHPQLKTEIKSTLAELCEGDVPESCLLRISHCLFLWDFILECYQIEIRTSSASICADLLSDCELFVQMLKRSDLHSKNAGLLWAAVARFVVSVIQSISNVQQVVQPLLDFFGIILNRMMNSPHFFLFDIPTIDKAFRYDLPTSIKNNDDVMKEILTLDWVRLLLKEIPTNWVKNLQSQISQCIETMPFRTNCIHSLLSLASSLYLSDEYHGEGKLLLPLFCGNSDVCILAIGWLSESSKLNDWIIENAHLMTETVLSKENQKRRERFVVTAICQLARFVYFQSEKKVQMQFLLSLETLIINANQEMSSFAISTLQFIASDPSSHELLESFTARFIKKEWNHTASSPTLLFRLAILVSKFIPSFASFAIACQLYGGIGEIETALMMNGSILLGSTLL